jgi:hypothetical protein
MRSIEGMDGWMDTWASTEHSHAYIPKQTGIQVTRRGGHQRPSLLFDPKQAADIDTHAVHAMAVEGLEALLADGADPRLGRYREVSFNRIERSIEHAVPTDWRIQFIYTPYILRRRSSRTRAGPWCGSCRRAR